MSHATIARHFEALGATVQYTPTLSGITGENYRPTILAAKEDEKTIVFCRETPATAGMVIDAHVAAIDVGARAAIVAPAFTAEAERCADRFGVALVPEDLAAAPGSEGETSNVEAVPEVPTPAPHESDVGAPSAEPTSDLPEPTALSDDDLERELSSLVRAAETREATTPAGLPWHVPKAAVAMPDAPIEPVSDEARSTQDVTIWNVGGRLSAAREALEVEVNRASIAAAEAGALDESEDADEFGDGPRSTWLKRLSAQ